MHVEFYQGKGVSENQKTHVQGEKQMSIDWIVKYKELL